MTIDIRPIDFKKSRVLGDLRGHVMAVGVEDFRHKLVARRSWFMLNYVKCQALSVTENASG
jgi:hypothetical protein